MQKIDDILHDADAQMNKMGAEAVIDSFYSRESTPQFTRLKEDWELGFFVQEYNELHTPALVWACRNQPGTNHADFSIYAADKSYLWDVEVTSLFSNPKPQPYATLDRIIKSHLRDKYPPYWLVIYDNDYGVEHPNFKHLANLIQGILQARMQVGRLSSNLQQVWVFDCQGVMRAWP